MINEILLIPEKTDIERDLVAKHWKKNGGEIKKIGKFWVQPNIDINKRITIYGIDTFSLVLAQVIGVNLIEPKDERISEINYKWLKRKISIMNIKDVSKLQFPTFIKPVKPKSFKSAIYKNIDDFFEETKGIEKKEKIIQSDIIKIESEVRAFILNNEILDLAIYEGNSDLSFARSFLNEFLNNNLIDLPKTYVIDLGYNKIDDWFIIEFNSSWGAGLNSCNPNKVIKGIREATINN